MATLRISRDSGLADITRHYQIVANGKVIGKIGNGETKDFEIEAKTQDVYLVIDWCRSNKLTIEAAQDDHIHLFAKSSLRGFKMLLVLVYIIFLPTSYIRLSRANG